MLGTIERHLRRKVFALVIPVFLAIALALSCPLAYAGQPASPVRAVPQTQAQELGKAFASPDEAAAALYEAAKNNDEAALMAIFGPNARDVINWSSNPADRQSDRQLFAEKYAQMHRLIKEPDGTMTLYIGAENWPLPVPLVEKGGEWYFDIAAGKNEILYRRVGRNELEAMQVCETLVDAEKDFYGASHECAPKFISSGAAHDGLFWPVSASTANSPIGPFLAHAGYSNSADPDRAPFHGYFYRILLGQGPAAPGGARSYIANGRMTGGFAILAFPVEYASSGVMTFIVNQDGVIYEKNLGANTEKLAQRITQYDPDSTWKKTQPSAALPVTGMN